jgi:hypothetical protein
MQVAAPAYQNKPLCRRWCAAIGWDQQLGREFHQWFAPTSHMCCYLTQGVGNMKKLPTKAKFYCKIYLKYAQLNFKND